MPTRVVNITLIRGGEPLADDDITISLRSSVAFTEEGIVPAYPLTVTTDVDGEASATLDVPSTGAWIYRFTYSDSNYSDVALGAGDPVDLRTLLVDPSVPEASTGATLHPALTVTFDILQDEAWTASTQVLVLRPDVSPRATVALAAEIKRGLINEVDTSAGSVSLTLPAVAGLVDGARYGFKVNGLNTLTLDGNGAELIDSRGTYVLRRHEQVVWLVADTTAGGWVIVNEYWPQGQPFVVGSSLVGGVDYVA